jgi:protein tyrosine phosphatase (PTP) superfamily phosphohydrolase (DUF442 family)
MRAIAEHHVQTVINLRGTNPDEPWYRAEREAALASGAVLVDLPLASDQWLSHEQAESLIHVLDTVKYPALVHCEWGAERTGLVAATAVLLRPGSTLAEARAQFSLYYLFVNIKDGRVMHGHLTQYERWLSTRRAVHSPDDFRRWLLVHYEPEGNSRENWPCNPYPLRVVTTRSCGGEIVVESKWSSNRCPRVVADQLAKPAVR